MEEGKVKTDLALVTMLLRIQSDNRAWIELQIKRMANTDADAKRMLDDFQKASDQHFSISLDNMTDVGIRK